MHTRSPITWVPTLYLAEGLPFYTVALIAGLMYKSMGVGNDEIARWTGLLGLAWVFKPLWSPLLEAAASKKALVVFFQFTGAACLALVALALQLSSWFAMRAVLPGPWLLLRFTVDMPAETFKPVVNWPEW